VSSPPLASRFRLPRGVLIAGFVIVGAGASLDLRAPLSRLPLGDYVAGFGYGWLVLLIVCDLATLSKGSLAARRLAFTLGGIVLMLAWAAGLAAIADRYSLRDLVRPLFTHAAIYLWGATLWFASTLIAAGPESRGPTSLTVGLVLLLLYGAQTLASAVASRSYNVSLEHYGSDRALPLALATAWVAAAGAYPGLREATARPLVAFLAVLEALALVVWLAHLAGGEGVRDFLVKAEMIHAEHPMAGDRLPRFRLQFPMVDFNRAAYLALIAGGALVLSTLSEAKGRMRRWPALGLAGVSFLTLTLSYTRGALVSALSALALWTCLAWRKGLIFVLLGSGLLVVLMPAEGRRHVLSIFDPATYRPQGTEITSMRQRFMAWEWAVGEIARHPWTGWGYDWRITRQLYYNHGRESGDPLLLRQIEGGYLHQHLHNVWLETAFESGLPAAALLAAFTLWRWTLIARVFRRSRGLERRRAAAWAALEWALFLFGLLFYMLRRNFGYLSFFVWVYALSEMAEALKKRRASDEKPAVSS